jgi:hypothetical protein
MHHFRIDLSRRLAEFNMSLARHAAATVAPIADPVYAQSR